MTGIPLTRSSLSPLFWWHGDTKCEPSTRHADYYYTTAAAAQTGGRRSCTVSTGEGEKSAEQTQASVTTQEEHKESWEIDR